MACFWSFTVFGQFASTRSGPRSTRPCSVTKTASGAERSRYPMRFAGQLAERFLTSSSIAGWPSEVSRCEGAAIRKSSLAPTLHGHLLVGEAAPTGAVFELAGTAVALQRAPKDKPSIATPAGPTLASASPNRPDLLWLTRHLTPHRACVVLLWSATSRMLDLNLPAVCDVSVTNVCNGACEFCGFARDKTLTGAARYLDADAFSAREASAPTQG